MCSITVRFTPAAAGAMTATLTAASSDPVATATDALTGVVAPAIYWANAGDHAPGAGAIWTANLDGTSPRAIATGQDDPAGVAVDASHLYWASIGDNDFSTASSPPYSWPGRSWRPPGLWASWACGTSGAPNHGNAS